MCGLFKMGWPIVVLAIIFAAATPIVLSAQGEDPAKDLTPSFTLTISAAEAPAKAGSTVQIEVIVTNISGHDILLETFYTKPNVEVSDRVSIVDKKGASVSETQFGRAALGHTSNSGVTGKVVNTSLKADKSFTYPLNINELYDLSRPGKYKIQIERFDEESKSFVKSNMIAVTVIP